MGSRAKNREIKWGYTPRNQDFREIKFEKEVRQMANGHGGARPGAGRKKKALSEKLVDGNPGKAPLTKIQFGMQDSGLAGEDMPPIA